MNKEQIFTQLRAKGLRITPQRKALFDILENEHLTLKEIYAEMQKRGYNNLRSVYNNVDFVLSKNLVTQINIKGQKYYDLAIGGTNHSPDKHIHFTCENSEEIMEIDGEEIYLMIKRHPMFKNYALDKIHITVSGKCQICYGKKCDRYGH